MYQQIVAAYADPNRRRGKRRIEQLLDSLLAAVPALISQIAQLRRSLNTRRAEILAYFDIGVSNSLVEVINGRLKFLRGIALAFRNLDNYILRSLIHSGELLPNINAL